MRRFRSSLIGRVTVGFVVTHAIASALTLMLLWPFARWDTEDHVGPDAASAFLSADLQRSPDDALVLDPDGYLPLLARSNPGLWYVVQGSRNTLRYGPVPERADGFVALAGPYIKEVELGAFGAQGLQGDATAQAVDVDGERVVIVTGGVLPRTITFGIWMRYLLAETYWLVPLFFASLSVFGALVAFPLLMRSIKPTVRAAEQLSPTDLNQRLPEQGVVREVLPIVRAFNAALDRLAEAFEQRKRFIADVAHELRTPLAVLNMHVEELPDGGKKPDLQRSVYRLGQMVGQMLDRERLTLMDRERERIDLVALARGIVADIAPLAVANGYEIAFDSAPAGYTTDGDPHALARAISNVLGNAVAHGGNRGTIEVRLGPDGTLDVSDDGPGIPVEASERVFEPFRRERWDRDGCGLGLHLVREIMRTHGGDACVLPNSGGGATVRLTFAPALTA